ncbi:hypothetical protein L2E82_26764 [Cichorium intybus]|uniref:Uncharacterized protein n=1 Tax=Cichorium intybus TaxID=13427 RepID=A0ACB9CR39_CICIN|nr:hypothetical protein L2E82_26764 [Cichorium intybus]
MDSRSSVLENKEWSSCYALENNDGVMVLALFQIEKTVGVVATSYMGGAMGRKDSRLTGKLKQPLQPPLGKERSRDDKKRALYSLFMEKISNNTSSVVSIAIGLKFGSLKIKNAVGLEMRQSQNQQSRDLEVVMMGCCDPSERFVGFRSSRKQSKETDVFST